MSPMKRLAPAMLAAAIGLSGAAVAAGLSGADAAKDRIENMKGMGKASKAVVDTLKSGAPDMAVIKMSAAKIDTSAKALPGWFPTGSGQEAWAKSHALPKVWSDAAGFRTKAKALGDAAAKFDAVAQTGDAAAAGAAFHDVGAACKACHDTYKAKDPS